MELSDEDYAQAMKDIRKDELEKCRGCQFYDPHGTAEGSGYCGYSSEGHCAYEPIPTLNFDPHFCEECDTEACAENLMNEKCPRAKRFGRAS